MLISGTVLLFLNPNSSAGTPVHRPGDEPVRGGTAPSVIETPGATASGTATPGPTGTPAPQRAYTGAPPFTIDPSASYTATIHTDKGDITIQLDPKAAPQTVNNFVFLADNRFYSGLSFQRVIPDFLVQAGAPIADGSGGPGYTIPDENSPLKHDLGAVAMAESASAPNSAGSQFYIVLKPDGVSTQDGKDTVFGKVTAGLDILKALPARDPTKAGSDAAPLTIQSIAIKKQ
ncbi:MAG: peptidylprolyl isomerase [Dehalococcoidia bacterium]